MDDTVLNCMTFERPYSDSRSFNSTTADVGVTEAGEGEDGRMKSAIGIGTLLADGLGDTIRVSLTEDPEDEYPDGYGMYADPSYQGDFDGFQGEVVFDEHCLCDIPGNSIKYE